MLNFLKILTKRPSDKFIKISKIIFWLTLILSLYYNLIYLNKEIDSSFFWYTIDNNYIICIKYFIVSLWLVPLIMWAFNICMLKSKYIRILQIIFAILLFYTSTKFKDSPDLDIDVLLVIIAFFPLLAWITGKCITSKCLRYKEKITKIRV